MKNTRRLVIIRNGTLRERIQPTGIRRLGVLFALRNTVLLQTNSKDTLPPSKTHQKWVERVHLRSRRSPEIRVVRPGLSEMPGEGWPQPTK